MEHRFDVVIYGGTASGVIAAVAAAQEGARAAYSSLRMEGVAAALAVKNNVAVQRVHIVELQSKLVAQRQVIVKT